MPVLKWFQALSFFVTIQCKFIESKPGWGILFPHKPTGNRVLKDHWFDGQDRICISEPSSLIMLNSLGSAKNNDFLKATAYPIVGKALEINWSLLGKANQIVVFVGFFLS